MKYLLMIGLLLCSTAFATGTPPQAATAQCNEAMACPNEGNKRTFARASIDGLIAAQCSSSSCSFSRHIEVGVLVTTMWNCIMNPDRLKVYHMTYRFPTGWQPGDRLLYGGEVVEVISEVDLPCSGNHK